MCMARERLDKMLASRGAGSRKEVGGLIRAGRVTVNGAACRDPACKVDADVDAMLESVQQKLADLHRLDEAIPDTGLSASIRRMETAGRSILAEVEAHPEKAPQIRRFANYYLLDAVRILELYARLEGQDVQGGNAASVRREVETNAASIATAFENQLDSLFAADALDLSADLEVLNGMLRGQGLTGSDFAQKPEEQ